jgi:hypothetical protein
VTAVTSARLADRTGDENYCESVTLADWIATLAAAAGIGSAIVALSQARIAKTQAAAAVAQAESAKTQAEAAETQVAIATSQAESAKTQAVAAAAQVAAAERSAQAAESSAALARESLETAEKQFRLQTDSVYVDYTPVLLASGSVIDAETSFRTLEIRWKGPRVELDRLVATHWMSVDTDGEPTLDQFSAVDVELQPAGGKKLPHTISAGENLLFDWPGAQPGPRGFSAEVRAEYKLGGAGGATLNRSVEVYGYDGFKG